MFENIYDNIGGKIKGLAKSTFIVEAVAAVITGIAVLISTDILLGLIILVVGPIVAWVSSWLLYGFGELIDKASDIADNTRGSERKLEELGKAEEENQGVVKTEKSNHKKAPKQNVATDSTKTPQKNEVHIEEPKNILLCPECGEDLEFMGWSDADLEEMQTCPLCGKEISLKQVSVEEILDAANYIDVSCPNCKKTLSFLENETDAICPWCNTKIDLK